MTSWRAITYMKYVGMGWWFRETCGFVLQRSKCDQKLRSVLSPRLDGSATSRPPFVLLTMVNILHTKKPHLIQEDPLYPSKTGPTKFSY